MGLPVGVLPPFAGLGPDAAVVLALEAVEAVEAVEPPDAVDAADVDVDAVVTVVLSLVELVELFESLPQAAAMKTKLRVAAVIRRKLCMKIPPRIRGCSSHGARPVYVAASNRVNSE
jgi:hypothetical protein